MKRIVILLGLMALVLPGFAQNQIPDLVSFISFTAISNSPPPPAGLRGEADYFRTTKPVFPGMPTYTNRLEVYIGLPVPAVAGWIMEQEADGSFTPVAELTHQINEGSEYIYFQQGLTLTTNQIHHLIAGDFYAVVDFGDSSYWGRLAPQYAFANGPTAKMILPPPSEMHTWLGYTVISTNNRTAKFILDSSNCTDPFYLPMQFSWVGYAGWNANPSAVVFTATNAVLTRVFELGVQAISLQADDMIATGKPFYFSVNVVTAGQAVNFYLPILKSVSMPARQRRVLTEVLTCAAKSFDQGKMVAGCTLLEVYILLVKTSHFDSGLTASLLRPMQDVVDAFQPGGKPNPGSRK